ncbi:MAG: hypothetical protein M1815_002374 [Lichina confinis]|nr:MAG: hypothetical protein M1815_002374 [Lichina confinis]
MAPNGIHSAPAVDSPSTSDGTKSSYTTPPSALTSGDGRDTASMIGSGTTGTKVDSAEANGVAPGFQIAAAINANPPGERGDDAQFASVVGGMTDPFVTSTTIKGKGKALAADSPKGKYEQKLSATANSFTPSGNLTNFGNNTAKSLGSLFVDKNTTTDNAAVALTSPCVVNGSTPAVCYVRTAGVGGTALGGGSAAPIAPTFAGLAAGKTVVGIVVLNYHPEYVRADPAIMRLLNNFAVAKGRMGNRPDFNLDRTVHGQLRVECFHLPNLDEVSLFIRDQYPEWSLGDFNVTPKIRFHVYAAPDPKVVHVLVRYEGPANSFDDEAFDNSACVVFKRYGHVQQWHRATVIGFDGVGWICYYQEAGSAQDAIKHLHCHETTDVEPYMASSWHGKEALPFVRMIHFRRGPLSPMAELDGVTTSLGNVRMGSTGIPIAGSSIGQFAGPAGSPGVIGQERFGLTLMPLNRPRPAGTRRSSSATNTRRGSDGGPNHHHNMVDVGRIREGLDVRTTIMLRNIPNKLDQPMLKSIVDETSHGKYDFMYLRIDFANNCNVGYAFINFEDPYHITDFVKARAGYKWNCFNSDKIAEVSYATIQGKDCLVQKFRNSSVMLENPSFRPKVFHTGTGPLAGTEDKFPGPDNNSKMRRSIENAAHVGLFAPGGGQNPRHDQRRRRSQFDRGTRLAQIEEANGCVHPNMGRLSLVPVMHQPVSASTHTARTDEDHEDTAPVAGPSGTHGY